MKRNGIQHTLIWFDMANAKPNLHNIMKNLLLSPHSKLYWVKDVKHLLNSVENFEKMFKKKNLKNKLVESLIYLVYTKIYTQCRNVEYYIDSKMSIIGKNKPTFQCFT